MLDRPLSELAVHRHGAFAAVGTRDAAVTLLAYPTLTRRGSKTAFRSLEQSLVSGDLLGESATYGWGDVLIAARVESKRIVREIRVPLRGDDEPDTGVREPRRPYPHGGAAEDRAPLPDDAAHDSWRTAAH